MFWFLIEFEINTSEIPSPDFNCQINCFKYTHGNEEITNFYTNRMGRSSKTKINKKKQIYSRALLVGAKYVRNMFLLATIRTGIGKVFPSVLSRVSSM